jgi:hypothetical protein
MAYLEAARIAENNAWTKRVQMVALNAAVDIMAEDPATAEHASRAALANLVIRGDQTISAALPKLVLTNEVVRAAAVADIANWGAAVLDSDLEFVVATLWTSTSLVFTPAAA